MPLRPASTSSTQAVVDRSSVTRSQCLTLTPCETVVGLDVIKIVRRRGWVDYR